MSLCVVDGKACRCQPEEGSRCPGVVELRARIAELEKALRKVRDLAQPEARMRVANTALMER
jgi:hypothetical protein